LHDVLLKHPFNSYEGFPMKRVLLLCTIAAAALTIQTAKADNFTISFNDGQLGASGSVNVVATDMGSGVFDVTGVLAGGSVTIPFVGTSDPVAVSDFAGSDNILTFPNGGVFFDDNGFSFALADGVNLNLFVDGDGNEAIFSDTSGNGGFAEAVLTETVTPFSPPPSSVPEPSSLVLLGTSAVLCAADLFRRRRALA
jgi:hypothetical protein